MDLVLGDILAGRWAGKGLGQRAEMTLLWERERRYKKGVGVLFFRTTVLCKAFRAQALPVLFGP